jgi:integrase
MPRPAKGARLYLRDRRQRGAVWVILDHGREISTGASESDIGTAEKVLAEYIGRKRRPRFGNGQADQVLIADVLAEYGDIHGPKTRRPDLIGFAIGKLLDFFGDRTTGSITRAACNAYVDWRVKQAQARHSLNKKPIKSSTARRELVVLSAALRWCWKEGKIDRPIPITLPPQAGSRERHLSRREVAALLAGALGWDRNGLRHRSRINRHLARFILLALYTGTRHDAILRLQWTPNTQGGWIDLDAGVIYRKAGAAVDSSKRRPPVPIPPRLLPHLRRWRRLTARYAVEYAGRPIKSKERRASVGGPRSRSHPAHPQAYVRDNAPATRRIGLRRGGSAGHH